MRKKRMKTKMRKGKEKETQKKIKSGRQTRIMIMSGWRRRKMGKKKRTNIGRKGERGTAIKQNYHNHSHDCYR